MLNQERVVDGSLKLGATSEIMTVSGTEVLNTFNSQVGGELSTQELIDLPESTGTKGANEFLITKTFAGAASSSQDYSNVNNLSLGGGRAGTNPIIIDGLPSNMGIDGTYGLIPTPDSTEELQVLTAPFSAQYGQSGGGAILTTTRSGTENSTVVLSSPIAPKVSTRLVISPSLARLFSLPTSTTSVDRSAAP